MAKKRRLPVSSNRFRGNLPDKVHDDYEPAQRASKRQEMSDHTAVVKYLERFTQTTDGELTKDIGEQRDHWTFEKKIAMEVKLPDGTTPSVVEGKTIVLNFKTLKGVPQMSLVEVALAFVVNAQVAPGDVAWLPPFWEWIKSIKYTSNNGNNTVITFSEKQLLRDRFLLFLSNPINRKRYGPSLLLPSKFVKEPEDSTGVWYPDGNASSDAMIDPLAELAAFTIRFPLHLLGLPLFTEFIASAAKENEVWQVSLEFETQIASNVATKNLSFTINPSACFCQGRFRVTGPADDAEMSPYGDTVPVSTRILDYLPVVSLNSNNPVTLAGGAEKFYEVDKRDATVGWRFVLRNGNEHAVRYVTGSTVTVPITDGKIIAFPANTVFNYKQAEPQNDKVWGEESVSLRFMQDCRGAAEGNETFVFNAAAATEVAGNLFWFGNAEEDDLEKDDKEAIAHNLYHNAANGEGTTTEFLKNRDGFTITPGSAITGKYMYAHQMVFYKVIYENGIIQLADRW